MNILINFSTLKAGGGQNVALNIVNAINDMEFNDITFFFIIAENTEVHKLLKELDKKNYITVSQNPLKRIFFELFKSKKLLNKQNIDIIYTYFGIGLFSKSIPQVSGIAVSNLFFPEIDFWQEYSGFALLKRKIVDKYRAWGLKRADGLIFENKEMEIRSHKLFNITSDKTIFIKPSITIINNNTEYKLPNIINDKNTKKALFLCGWQLNKNIMLIPEIASCFKSKNIEFHFILTAPKDNSILHKQFIDLCNKYNVNNMISVVGAVKKEELSSLYSQIDFVFLLSKLESFSNNIIEAWHYKKLLVISDELWSRSICGTSALYVKRNNANLIAESVVNIIENNELYNEIVQNAVEELKQYPSTEEKVIKEINFIKKIYTKSKK